MTTVAPLSTDATKLLVGAFNSGSAAYNAVVSAAGNSPYFAGLLNAFAQDGQNRIFANGGGTYTVPNPQGDLGGVFLSGRCLPRNIDFSMA